MKKNTIGLIFFIFLLVSCESGGEGGGEIGTETPELKILDASQISETGFQLNWSIINQVGFNTIEILLYEDKEMTTIVKFIELSDISAQHVTFDGLKGATQYFYKVFLNNQGSSVAETT